MRTSSGFGLSALVVGLLVVGPLPATAQAGGPCVAIGHTCYRSLAAAVAAAKDGDVVRVPAGHFRGGLVIDADITLAGAGPRATVIEGGNHVLTVGRPLAAESPRVTISGVTLTGGLARFSEFDGGAFNASGGGLEIPPNADFSGGATVVVRDSVIAGNRAIPTEQLHRTGTGDWPICPGGPCPYAGASGAGVDNWGTLSLIRTTVSSNVAAGKLTSDAVGGGIRNFGTLTLDRSAVVGNRALAGPAWGRFAEGGGIISYGDSVLTVRHSTVSGNVARLVSSFPSFLDDGTYLDMLANAGGIHSSAATTTITGSTVNHNVAEIRAPNAQWGAIDAAILVDGPELILDHTVVRGNVLRAELKTAPDAPGTIVEWDGHGRVSHLTVTDNLVSVHTAGGTTGASAAVAFWGQASYPARSELTRSTIARNTVRVNSDTGDVFSWGGGLFSDGVLALDRVSVVGNRVVTGSKAGSLQGAGIWTGRVLGEDDPPSISLAVTRSRILGNALVAAHAVDRAGGGIFNLDATMALTATTIRGNVPDQCAGQGCPAAARTAAAPTTVHPNSALLRDRSPHRHR